MTLMQFVWIAATFVLGSILICALTGLLIIAQWLDFQDKQAQPVKRTVYHARWKEARHA